MGEVRSSEEEIGGTMGIEKIVVDRSVVNEKTVVDRSESHDRESLVKMECVEFKDSRVVVVVR